MLQDGDDIFYRGAKKNENGVIRRVKCDETLVSKGNCIMFICDGDGSCGYTNYINDDFIGSTTTSVGYNKNLNRYSGQFLVSILDMHKYKYSHSRKYRNSLQKEIVMLPVDNKGNPDWEWMELYMKSLEKGLDEQMKSIMEVSNGDVNTIKIFANRVDINDFKVWLNTKTDMSKNQMSLNSIKWKEYCLGNLFNTPYKGFAYTKTQIENDIPNGSLPVFYVTRTENNNAVSAIINISDNLKGIEEGNAIIIGDTTATVSYQKDKFICGDHIVILRANWLNYYTGLFIKSIIEYDKYKYSYGRAFNIEYIINSNVYLPTSDNINPDWHWIEQYMKSLPYSDK